MKQEMKEYCKKMRDLENQKAAMKEKIKKRQENLLYFNSIKEVCNWLVKDYNKYTIYYNTLKPMRD